MWWHRLWSHHTLSSFPEVHSCYGCTENARVQLNACRHTVLSEGKEISTLLLRPFTCTGCSLLYRLPNRVQVGWLSQEPAGQLKVRGLAAQAVSLGSPSGDSWTWDWRGELGEPHPESKFQTSLAQKWSQSLAPCRALIRTRWKTHLKRQIQFHVHSRHSWYIHLLFDSKELVNRRQMLSFHWGQFKF